MVDHPIQTRNVEQRVRSCRDELFYYQQTNNSEHLIH